ncbi:MAG TPA: hypothetical protein VGO56_10600 [Pyrinomonadaceae bacterium]|jgi:hypothetical protein|nr:hypothetical protein [Pyrinomonadaceae bacterium]
MPEVSLNKFRTNYLLPARAWAEQQRCDRLRLEVLDNAFATAIQNVGLPAEAELCIRDISAAVRLRLNTSDQSIAAQWGSALAEKLAQVIREGPASQRIFYYSRRQAVFDLALSVARDDYERAWAWQLLGLWPDRKPLDDNDAASELIRRLRRESNLILPSLRLLATVGSLPALSRKLSANCWDELAEGALVAANADVFLARQAIAEDAPPSSRIFSYALRVLKRSKVLAGIAASGTLAEADEQMRLAVATLAVLDAEPALLQAGIGPTLLNVVAASLAGDRAEIVAAENETKSVATKKAAGEKAAQLNTRVGQTLESRPGREESRPTLQEGQTPSQHDSAVMGSDNSNGIGGTIDEPLAIEQDVKSVNEFLDPRRRRITEFGGLLFLLNLIELLNLPEQILADPALASRPFVWTLHQLAMALASIEPDDAAALAFAGLAPDAVPPSKQDQPATPDETRALLALAAKIVECLTSLVNYEHALTEELIEFVCRRRAEVVADPAWIEIRFSLDQVATEVRRSGLDLDPGYVAWLGVVVKFVYE